MIPKSGEAIIFVNYYGIISHKRFGNLVQQYKNNTLIIDNSQSFFTQPVINCLNVYSARKFVGVPDGAYVIGENAEKFKSEYRACHSLDTALFLLKRIEYGCEGETYSERMKNEECLDREDILLMSKLTYAILDGTDYKFIMDKRKENFSFAHMLFSKINKINPLEYYDDSCVPMVYPLVVENDDLLNTLLEAKHFQGHWWSYLLKEMPMESTEYWLSKYIIPITIDQRYDRADIQHIYNIVTNKEVCKNA